MGIKPKRGSKKNVAEIGGQGIAEICISNKKGSKDKSE